MQALAKQVQSKGRGDDTMLVHMTPKEVGGLQALAKAHGGSLTVNPHTGLPEAGFLDSILPMVAGAVLGPLTGGLVSPEMAGLLVGGGYGLATGDIGKGLMAGLGAYGGAGIGSQMGLNSNSFGMQSSVNPSGAPAFGTSIAPAGASPATAAPAKAPGTPVVGGVADAQGNIMEGPSGEPGSLPSVAAPAPVANPTASLPPSMLSKYGPYIAAGLPLLMQANTMGSVTPSTTPTKYPYMGPYTQAPRVAVQPTRAPGDTSEKLFFNNVNPTYLNADGTPAFGPVGKATGGLVALAAGGNFTVNGHTASDQLQALLDRFNDKDKLSAAENANLVSGIGDLYAGNKGIRAIPQPAPSVDTAEKNYGVSTHALPAMAGAMPLATSDTQPTVSGFGSDPYGPDVGMTTVDPQFTGSSDLGNPDPNPSSTSDVNYNSLYNSPVGSSISNSDVNGGGLFSTKEAAQAANPDGPTPIQYVNAIGNVLGWVIPGVGTASMLSNAGQGVMKGYNDVANNQYTDDTTPTLLGSSWLGKQLYGTGLTGDVGELVGKGLGAASNALGITTPPDVAMQSGNGEFPSDTKSGLPNVNVPVDPAASAPGIIDPNLPQDGEFTVGDANSPGWGSYQAAYANPDNSSTVGFSNAGTSGNDAAIQAAIAARMAAYPGGQAGFLADQQANEAASSSNTFAAPDIGSSSPALPINVGTGYAEAAGQAQTPGAYGDASLGTYNNPYSSWQTAMQTQNALDDMTSANTDEYLKGMVGGGVGSKGEQHTGGVVRHYADGGVDMQDGSFVMDARTVSELGNGSSSAGQELLARLGGQALQGPGDGVSDSIPASIDGNQDARVARDEVLFDPSAVARLGGGDIKKGADVLYGIMNKARVARKTAKRGEDTGLRRGIGGLV